MIFNNYLKVYRILTIILIISSCLPLSSCKKTASHCIGADISWVPQMEAEGIV